MRHLLGPDLDALKYPLWEMFMGFKNETCPVFWSGPCRVFVPGLEVQGQAWAGDEDRQEKGSGCR